MIPLVLSALVAVAAGQAVKLSQDVTSPKGPHSSISRLGFGTWELPPNQNAALAVADAIKVGYRHIGCVTAYNNQKALAPGIQQGLKDAGLNRSDIWVSTKLWSSRHGSKVQSGVDNNLQELGLDYIDLMITHFPIGGVNGKAGYDYVDVSSILLPTIHSETDLLRGYGKKRKSPSAKAKSATLASPTSTPSN
jgi:diketogulonate reductase-like aldo/keto reductase